MHRDLQEIIHRYEAAHARLHRFLATLRADFWSPRADPARWSVSECVSHLNLTSAAYVPIVRRALDEASSRMSGAPEGALSRRYRCDLTGRVMSLVAGPLPTVANTRIGRVRTKPQFVPTGNWAQSVIVEEFDRLQAEQIALVREADGRPIDQVYVRSPFDPRVRYNLYACFVILPRHQMRHLDQAEQVWRGRPEAREPQGA